jgi:hypothetical protein
VGRDEEEEEEEQEEEKGCLLGRRFLLFAPSRISGCMSSDCGLKPLAAARHQGNTGAQYSGPNGVLGLAMTQALPPPPQPVVSAQCSTVPMK